jgi:peroxin-5
MIVCSKYSLFIVNLPPICFLSLNTEALWDKEFQSHEDSMNALRSSSQPAPLTTAPNQEAASTSNRSLDPGEADELARTAGRLVETLRGEQNPKFKNSQFMGLMRQLQNREVVVEGNDLVETSNTTSSLPVDVKGKGKAVDVAVPSGPSASGLYRGSVPTTSSLLQNDVTMSAGESSQQAERPTMAQESDEDAYWRQENADFANWWNSQRPQNQQQQQAQPSTSQAKQAHPREWGDLQAAWDQFEATESGIKPVNVYQFQSNNPYLYGSTRHHLAHSLEQWPSFHQVS